ncbi:MAG: hypothetical protein ACYC3F_05270 [Gemmatimonadaceae bacterium]
MRPVVFGPSPLMEAALGVFKGQELGARRVRAEEDRSDELAARDRSAQLGALNLAHRTITNDLASETLTGQRAKQARADAAAARLRGSEFNRSGWYGNINDPADPEHDYDADYEKEAKISATKRALLAQGIPEIQAESAARHDVDQQAMATKQAATQQEREKTAAEIERIKAQTAAEWARARGAGSERSNPRLDRQINDQEQVVSAAARAVPTKREGTAQIGTDGKPFNAAAAAAFVADSTTKARTVDTERARLDALKSVRGDQDVMRSGGYTNPEEAAQAMAAELTALASRVQQRILTHPRATEEIKARARAELSRLQTLIVKKYQGESR